MTMTISEALASAKSKIHSDTPDLDSEVLLCFVLKKQRSHLITRPYLELSQSSIRRYFDLVHKRREHIPIAYLTNNKEFYGLDFYVNQHTLIPRPETEILVEQVLQISKELYSAHSSPITILDVGTGSGCIAISIAKNLNVPTYIHASDISKLALKVARRNAKTHAVEINFIRSDLLKDIKIKPDIIVANLPYITREIYEGLSSDITDYEPKKALLAPTRNYYYDKLQKQLESRGWSPILIFE
jgi:release factor glutamine methyltransferase